ncbi:unnamed protein product [Clonostachys chloroleuca]|uniref:Zn(2)-C6 fungal-type domain-containing protein n=1 Tax=Clonostachys chloroleuca TaxID=1926264 RepID=A0AA35Q1C8_9HYPO|nr:unnamed protein product [Clonostachys chloroleuca]
MVGVPGKSTACPDCRKRRRPCDRERPACGQCRRAGVECGGYGKPWIFVNSTVEQDDGIVLELRTKSYSMELEPVPKPKSRPLERRFINAIKAQINGRPVVLPQSLNRTSYEEIFVESFWSTYLPSPGAHSSKEAVLYNTSDWIHVVRDLYRDNGPLRMIFLANCVALKGFEDNKQWLVEKSHQMHGRALNAIARSLCHPDAYKSDAVLAAARMLILFEICYGESLVTATPQSRRWHTHGAGHMAIMYSRGPHCYKRGYAHQLFCDARLHQSVVDGLLRRRCLLSTPEWKEIPFSEIPKKPKDELIDVVSEVGGLFEDADSVRLLSDPKEIHRILEDVTTRAWSLNDDLDKWAIGSGRRIMEFMDSHLSTVPAEPPSNEELMLGDLAMNYLAFRVILHAFLETTAQYVPNMPRLDDIQPMDYCRQIGQYIPFFQAARATVWTIHMLALPVGSALTYLETQTGRKDAVEVKLLLTQAMSGKASSAIIRFLKMLQKYEGGAPRI